MLTVSPRFQKPGWSLVLDSGPVGRCHAPGVSSGASSLFMVDEEETPRVYRTALNGMTDLPVLWNPRNMQGSVVGVLLMGSGAH